MTGINLPAPAALDALLSSCLLADRFRLRRDWQRLRTAAPGAATDEQLARWQQRLEGARARREARRLALPVPRFDDSLPVSARREEIRALIARHQVVVIAGETGSGKTTQLPKILLELGRGVDGYIGHTQPRRLAARTVATRIAQELGTALGEGVGYQVRFTDQVSERSHIKLMTDGILLAEIGRDRLLEKYDTLIIDEAHERSLNIDFLLGYLKRLLPKRPDLKLVITSATIDHARFAKHFADAPVLEVSGRTYPVTIHYRPLGADGDERVLGLPQAIDRVLTEIDQHEREHGRHGAADVLVFCTGERDIRELHLHLKKSRRGVEVLPLYARLGNAEQNRVFAPRSGAGRRIVLATNVAETSITVPGIGYVIDPGLARISRYSARSRVQRLPIEAISQASANQRAGRCGRVAAGICYRLYEESDFLARPEYTDPEIRRTNLASVILQMLALGLGDIEQFPFIDPPDRRFVQDGWQLLRELGAIDADKKLTAAGRQLARLPVDPRLGRMLLEAARTGALAEVLVIVAALAVQDPRERPHDQQQAADQAHGEFADRDSDFLWFLNLWRVYEVQRRELGAGELRRWCERRFLSFLRLREWRETHHQLTLIARELTLAKLAPGSADLAVAVEGDEAIAAHYTRVHKALLSGLLSQVFQREEARRDEAPRDDGRREPARDAAERGGYLGAHNRRFAIWPGSALAKKGVAWGVAAELVETRRSYLRTVARVQPGWIEGQAGHLLRREYFDVQWQARRGMVCAREQVSLFGLVLHPGRDVHYGPIDPALARELFIRGALVNGDWGERAPAFAFVAANAAVADQVERLEAKLRRRDVRVDDEVLYDWYAARIPADIYSTQKFSAWYRHELAQDPQLLCFTLADLMARTPAAAATADFPDTAPLAGTELALDYKFAPGADDDGASLMVPLAALNQLQPAALDWLVPGLLRERCLALVKSLPKELRRPLVPVPDTLAAVLPRLPAVAAAGRLSLPAALAAELRRVSGQNIRAEDFNSAAVPPQLGLNLRVLGRDGEVLASGRDLAALKQQLAVPASQALPVAGGADIRSCDFAPVPLLLERHEGPLLLRSFPALVDAGGSCRVQAFADAGTARLAHRRGLRRLFLLHGGGVLKPIRRALPAFNEAAVGYRTLGTADELLDDLWLAVADFTFLRDEKSADDAVDRLRDGAACLACWNEHRHQLHEHANKLARVVADSLSRARDLRQRLFALQSSARAAEFAAAHADISAQLERLLPAHFVASTPVQWLTELPRYLQAVQLRLDKLPGQLERDRSWSAELQALVRDVEALRLRLAGEGRQSAALDEYQWMIEEYRVSLFAQTLGTRVSVSAQRLARQRERVLVQAEPG